MNHNSAASRIGQRHPQGDWPGDSEPGGCECETCGCIFIGSEWRSECKECASGVLVDAEASAEGSNSKQQGGA